jgi:hAT family C-terminal dimerisation region
MGAGQMNALRDAFERMTDVDTAAEALSEAQTYRMKAGSFSGPLAQKMACDGKTSPGMRIQYSLLPYHVCILPMTEMFYSFVAAWWQMFGSSTPTLQKLATRLVSQCASSTGCERNWSTFAFIHTKVRNRLSYKKLHKLVYVNYNLRIQNQIDGGSRHDDDFDPFARLMELTLVDASNPIREWMEGARSTNVPC